MAIFKINSIDFRLFVFICRASWICSRSLSISCAIIIVFSTRIFRNLGIEWFLRWKAIELVSLRCILSRQERVVVALDYGLQLYFYLHAKWEEYFLVSYWRNILSVVTRQPLFPLPLTLYFVLNHSPMNCQRKKIQNQKVFLDTKS